MSPEVQVSVPERPSLRERKKARTRQSLLEIAGRLFAQQGYEATTLEQICDEAEISIRTLFRYFESKEQLALDGLHRVVRLLREGLRAPDRRVDSVMAWREHVAERASEARASGEYLAWYRFVHGVPALEAGFLALNLQIEDLLTEGLARDAGTDPETDLHSRLLATTLVWGNSAVVRHWAAGGGVEDLEETCLQVIDAVKEYFPAATSTACAGGGGEQRPSRGAGERLREARCGQRT